jgi:hypothetical protein
VNVRTETEIVEDAHSSNKTHEKAVKRDDQPTAGFYDEQSGTITQLGNARIEERHEKDQLQRQVSILIL